ncbi:MAG TPA: polyhydroxyalkanoate synthesis regulator DNA-binding domain-containing protein [Anaerolineae bacterium]|nr:polyhydroxyalkanoate synthesis regulator DNA-binding domain-containing protein [Anaerolineae bacterium]
MPIIKRYSNRKLYDTYAKQYVTLLQLAEMIRQGDDVVVLDHASGEDITSQIQAQIIFEEQRQAGGSLPNTLLTNLIQTSGERTKEFSSPLEPNTPVDFEIRRRMELLIKRGEISQRQGAQLLEKLLSLPPATPPLQELYLKRALEKRGTPTRAQLQQLAANVEHLRQELDSVKRKKARTSRARRRMRQRGMEGAG